ncbi:MAG TPA: hypothetical protein VF979_07470 [Streptosporangiaceae bacterium]
MTAGAEPNASLEVTTRRTITATAAGGEGITLDELASFLRRAMAAGIDPDTPVRVRANRKGVVTAISVEGVAVHG